MSLTRDAKDFQDIVAKDIKNQSTTEEYNYLRSESQIDNWYDALINISRSIDFQFASNKAQKRVRQSELDPESQDLVEYLEWYSDWKLKTLRFKHEVEARISECKSIRRNRSSSSHTDLHSLILFLVQAIDNHRASILAHLDDESDDFGSQADEQLWSAIDDETLETLSSLLKRHESSIA